MSFSISSFIYSIFVDSSLRKLRKYIPEFAGMKSGDRVLDVCCATGAQVFYYAKLGIDAVGADKNPAMIEFAEKKRKKLKIENVSFQVADATKLPFTDNTFDYASISLGLHENDAETRDKIISVLNSRDVENKMPASFRVLTNNSLEESKDLIKNLLEKSESRREKIKEIAEKIKNKISDKDPILFEGEAGWDVELISPIASILCQKTKKPVFIYKKLKDQSVGTVRTPEGVNSVVLMKKCKKLLMTFGGHPLASGFRVRNENLEKFKKCLIKNLKK